MMMTEFLPEKKFMIECLRLAQIAYEKGEVPVGAVVEINGEIIGYGYNKREMNSDPLGHAEIIAIKMASEKLGSWRLSGANLYVSLEPCPMCTGAVINSRIERVIFGAHDLKGGCLGSVSDFTKLKFNHKPKIYRGFMELECSKILKKFFSNLRN